MLHHSQDYINGVVADRHAAAELERVVLAARGGDAGAWTALIERFTARVRGEARRHRLAAHDVDDVMQTTWVRLLEHVDGVREPGALGAWLETTARRESLRVLHHRRRESPADAELFSAAEEAPVDEQHLVQAERRAALEQALERLPRRPRALLALLLADPAPSYVEISHALDMPIGSIGPTRARCLARLRRDPQLVAVTDDGL